MAHERILIVDDEAHIRELARLYLEQEGFQVLEASDGAEALRCWQNEAPDLIILDLMLPQIDGWQVCRTVRAHSDVPIIMLTARSDAVDKIVGLEIGADDYVTKPFNPRELAARVKAVLRRAGGKTRRDDKAAPLVLGDLRIDPAAREVSVGQRPIELRAKEFELLLTLARHAGQVLSREQLLSQVWGYDFYGETRTVDVHIAHLRRHLKGSRVAIETVWGIGYKLTVN